MEDTLAAFPLWVIAVDYLLGMVMWTLIGRSAMNLFLPVDSDWFFMKFFVRATNPILKVFNPVTPGFLIDPIVPLFVAWFSVSLMTPEPDAETQAMVDETRDPTGKAILAASH